MMIFHALHAICNGVDCSFKHSGKLICKHRLVKHSNVPVHFNWMNFVEFNDGIYSTNILEIIPSCNHATNVILNRKTFEIIYFQFSCKLFMSSAFTPKLTWWHKCTLNATILNSGDNKFAFFLFLFFSCIHWLCVSRFLLSPFRAAICKPFVLFAHSKTTKIYTN